MKFISELEWINFLFEEGIDPDFWCDCVPEDYGFKLRIRKVNK